MTRKRLLTLVYKRHGQVWDENYNRLSFPVWQRFYWFKTLLCILFGLVRLPDYSRSQWPDFEYIGGVAYYDEHEHYFNGKQWTEIGVGRGVFTGWYYTIYDNGEM